MNTIDEYGELKGQLEPMLRRLEWLHEALTKLEAGVHQGMTYTIYVVPKTRKCLDTKLLKRECPKIYAEYSRETDHVELTVRKNTP